MKLFLVFIVLFVAILATFGGSQKESYDTKKVITNLDLDIATDSEGNTMRIEQEMTADYIGINTIDAIDVPQEVIDSAQEI